jgi:hypothetical protein
MWDHVDKNSVGKKGSIFALDWIGKRMNTPHIQKQAEEAFAEAEKIEPKIHAYRTTPQTLKWHAEGPVLADHIHRILRAIFAVQGGASLLEIEEFAREKDLRDEIIEIEETLRAGSGTVIAFALLHDIAKRETLSFNALESSKGASLGFTQREGKNEPASEEDMMHYLKQIRLLQAAHPELSGQEVTKKYYIDAEITVHNYHHDRIGASEAHLEARNKISDLYRLTPREQDLLVFIIRNHIRVLMDFKKEASATKYNVLVERATKEGFDADDALDLLIVCLLLDSGFGSLQYTDGTYRCDFTAVINMLRAERAARPGRHKKREAAAELVKKQARKKVLKKAGLGSEEIYKLLGIKFGRERGEVKVAVMDLVASRSSDYNFGEHTEEIHRRVKRAKALLT